MIKNFEKIRWIEKKILFSFADIAPHAEIAP
jgi:hypothetical protein